MSDINDILAKHFSSETSLQEESQVQEFKMDHPQEYAALRSFWEGSNPKVSKVNTAEAWEKVSKSTFQNQKKPNSNVGKWIVAIVMLVLLGLLVKTFVLDSNEVQKIDIAAIHDIKKVVLEDGSIIHLNKNAVLSYPVKFSQTSREVQLEGEAFFEIKKDASRPFKIATVHTEVEVLGTSFNINTNEQNTVVDVLTGKVLVRSLETKKRVYLTPDQSASANDNELTKYPTTNKNYLAWKTGVLNFDNLPVVEVIETINKYRNNRISLLKTDRSCNFSGTISHNNIEEIAEILKLSCKLKLTSKNGNYELY